jgi:hypothetical protein
MVNEPPSILPAVSAECECQWKPRAVRFGANRMSFAPPVIRILTDQDEGMGPEVEDYVACWFEIAMTGVEGEGTKQIVTLGTDFKYSLNDRHVTVRKS